MKLVTKNGNKFATGIFWQIADEGKRSINLAKLVKDTKHNMFCQIKTINPTWGFCHKEELQGEKKVASLGKFIVEASKLSANYANSIICFKFKNAGELDEDGRELETDLYGYIVLLHGTICPDEGEYVATFELVRESIISQAKKYEIEILYLPLDVSNRFFSIFELLRDVSNNDVLLNNLMQNLSAKQTTDLKGLINEFEANSGYNQLIDSMSSVNLHLVRDLINEPEFENKLKEQKDQVIKYLIPNVITLPFTSDEIYWENPKYKKNYQSALLESISRKKSQKYKLGALVALVGTSSYLGYQTFIQEKPIIQKTVQKPVIPKPTAVTPLALIENCLVKNDKYFQNFDTWTLTGLKCNSLEATLTFDSYTDTTLAKFAQLVGSDTGIKLTGKVGIYTIKHKVNTLYKNSQLASEQILSHLQQSAIDYSLKLNVPQSRALPGHNRVINKFTITSKQSPVFLFNHGILNDIRLREINMTFDKNTGFYSWTIQGEF